jgi:hypothetical protein
MPYGDGGYPGGVVGIGSLNPGMNGLGCGGGASPNPVYGGAYGSYGGIGIPYPGYSGCSYGLGGR